MVGNSMFTVQLNNRLKDLKGSKEFEQCKCHHNW